MNHSQEGRPMAADDRDGAWRDFAEQLASHLDDALDALDPEGDAPELSDHRATLRRFTAWQLEQQGQHRLRLDQLA